MNYLYFSRQNINLYFFDYHIKSLQKFKQSFLRYFVLKKYLPSNSLNSNSLSFFFLNITSHFIYSSHYRLRYVALISCWYKPWCSRVSWFLKSNLKIIKKKRLLICRQKDMDTWQNNNSLLFLSNSFIELVRIRYSSGYSAI